MAAFSQAEISQAERAELLAFAETLADCARAVILPYFRAEHGLEDKGAGGVFDPVTQADRAAEEAIRSRIERHCPDHGILGEEFGETAGRSAFRWVIDPIDGTRAFISGLPVWTTLIGLEYKHAPIIGVIDQGFTGERWSGVAGVRGAGGAARYARGDAARILRTRRCPDLGLATIAATDPRAGHMFDGGEAAAFAALAAAARLARFGGDAYAYAMLAAGEIDIVAEAGLKPFDVCALIPVIEAAGGRITDWAGGPAARGGQIVAAGDPRLHGRLIAALAPVAKPAPGR